MNIRIKPWAVALMISLTALAAQASSFKQLDKASAKQLLDVANYKKPTVVVLWSSDCGHCKRNLAMLQDLIKRDKTLHVVTVAVEPETAALAPILDRNNMPATQRYAYGHDNPDALAYALDPNWAGELPRTYLFNGVGGKQALSGVLSPKMVETALKAP